MNVPEIQRLIENNLRRPISRGGSPIIRAWRQSQGRKPEEQIAGADEHHRRVVQAAHEASDTKIERRAEGPERVLTSDNPHLSRPKNDPSDDPDSPSNESQSAPIEDQSPTVDAQFVQFPARHRDPIPCEVETSVADDSRRAYRSDLAHFAAWDGPIPTEPALDLAHFAAWDGPIPAEPALAASYVATLIRCIATISKAHEARGLPNPCRSDVRERALLLIGFAGGFRRSEVVGSIATTSSACGKGS